MSKMTLWFPPHIKPVHKGVYETADRHKMTRTLPTYARWDGKKWSNPSYRKHHLELHYTSYGASQDNFWRGFKEKQT